jgi:hypothetical protein
MQYKAGDRFKHKWTGDAVWTAIEPWGSTGSWVFTSDAWPRRLVTNGFEERDRLPDGDAGGAR